eukprot:scaffold357711_cov43-Prasinocladus_malaysianus.AAC.1
MEGQSSSFGAVAVALLHLCAQTTATSSGITGSATAAIDPEAFAASTPLETQSKRPLEGVFAGFLLHMVVGGAAEEYQGTLQLKEQLEAGQKKEIIDEVYRRTGEHYAAECEYQGLPAPKNLTSIPVNRELANPKYFAAYSYAAFLTTWEVIRDKAAFKRFHDRIGGRVFDAIAQYTQFEANHDMEDIKGMRKNLGEFLSQYAKLGLAEDAGALFVKGTDKKWKAGEDVTFKMFTAYLVEAQFAREYSDDKEPSKLIQEWTITPM